jgi:DNA-binding NtrC family response regulator
VFIQGESGSGKEMIAALIHRASLRQGEYLPLNCANFRGDLAAAAIFGHTPGAFTGAMRAQIGAARAAHRGTLFLDEVGELTLDIQPLLLRLLQNGEVTPVGSHQAQHVDVRVITATHRQLWTLCQQGKFREDLYFRLTPYEVRVPALSERREDILALFVHFAGRVSQGMSAGFVSRLLAHAWPGNVRELQNFAARLRVSAGSEPIWRSRHAPEPRDSKAPEPELNPSALSADDWKQLYERHGRVAANISRATGLAVSTVKRYLQKHGLRG